MFDFSRGKWPVPQDLAALFTLTFDEIASPGNGWNGAERLAIAATARNGSVSNGAETLPNAAVDAATRVAKDQTAVHESWVRDTVSEIGDTHYVEVVGIAAAMVAIDTVTELLGFATEPLPEPRPGEATREADNPKLKRRSAWVAMSGPPKPAFAVSAAPRTQAMVTRLADNLYPSVSEYGNGTPVRGLSREQIEIVALKISHSNECFW